MVIAAPNQVVRGADAALPASATRRSTKYAVEAIGAFLLVFTVGTAVGSGSPFAPLGIGAVLIVILYAGGHPSSGHYNPAVTLAVLVRRRIALRDAIAYWIIQFGAGMLAALVLRRIVDPARVAASTTITLAGGTLVVAFVAELLLTFALCYVVLNVATSQNHPNNSDYGFAIGFALVVGTFAVSSILGGASNPAVSLGIAAMDMFALPMAWVYLVAQTLAGIVAGVSFLALNPDDRRIGGRPVNHYFSPETMHPDIPWDGGGAVTS